MTLEPSDPILDRVIATCRTPVDPTPGFDRRVLSAVAARGRGGRTLVWAAVGLAAAVVLAVLGTRVLAPAASESATVPVRFELSLPEARSVALVGDFNDWDRSHGALLHAGTDGRWTATLDLPHGVYRYAFLVNGTSWIADPARPEIRDPDFDTPTSVVAIGAPAS
jgi:Glycogen recognition site of AMP-activated protein kinase